MWWLLLALPSSGLWNASTKSTDYAYGLYYIPSVAGIDALAQGGTSDLYGEYFHPIHERDIPLVSKAATVIRLSGFSSPFLTDQFLDICSENGVSVILTFALLEYNLLTQDIREMRSVIELDFEKFVKTHQSHKAVVMWCIGGLLDPVVGSDYLQSTDFTSKFLDVVSRLVSIANNYDSFKRPVSVSLNVEDYKYQYDNIDKFINIPFDYWIFDFGDTDEKHVSASFGALLTKAGNQHPVIAQFSVSAYDEPTLRVNQQKQDVAVVRMMQYFKAKGTPGKIRGYIVEEWSDQWWRGDTTYSCTSGLQAPYFQSRCNRGYHGMNFHTNSLGTHCLTVRPALVSVARSQAGIITVDETKVSNPMYSPSANVTFHNLHEGDKHCVYIFPTFFTNTNAWYIYAPLLFMFVLNIILYCLWRHNKRQEEKEIRDLLDKYSITGDSVEDSSLKPPAPQKSLLDVGRRVSEAKKPLLANEHAHESVAMGNIIEEPAPETRPLDVPGCQFKFVVTVSAKGNMPKVAGDGFSKSQILELYLREHIRRQKINIDCLIEHECKVLQAYADFKFATDLPTEDAVHYKAVQIIHCRMLEGYDTWIDKRGKIDKISVEDHYAEMLLYRLLSSMSEHIAHCPERLAFVYHQVLEKTQHDNSKVFTIDLDVLFTGIFGEFSIMEGNINFDDINECGILGESKLSKTWWESHGPAVLLDYARDYSEILFFKLWLFAGAVKLKGAGDQLLPPFAYIEAISFFVFEFVQFTYQWFWQARKFPLERVFGLLFALVSMVMFTIVVPKMTLAHYVADAVVYGYGAIRVLYCISPYQACLNVCRTMPTMYPTQMRGARKNPRTDFRINGKALAVAAPSTRLQSMLFWIMTMGLTVLTEVYLIVPVASSITVDAMCGLQCLTDMFHSNICLSCHLAVIISWGLMLVTVVIDTPLVFNVMVAVWGYYKGQSRKVQNVFAHETSHVDLTVNGRQRKNIEAIFGSWERSASEFWHSMIQELYDRDLICDADRVKLQLPGKKYDFTLINPEARERLSFFLRTIKSMAKAKRRHMAHALARGQIKQIPMGQFVDDEYQHLLSRLKQFERDKLIKAARERRDQKSIHSPSRFVLKPNTTSQARVEIMLDQEEDDDFDLETGSRGETRLMSTMSPPPSSNSLQQLEEKEKQLRDKKRSWELSVPDTWNPKIPPRDYTKLPVPSASSSSGGEDGELEDHAMSPLDLDDEENNDLFLRCIPRLSHIITCYNETILLSREYLQARNGKLTNLERLMDLSSYRQEWAFLEERFKRKYGVDPQRDLMLDFLRARPRPEGMSALEKALIREVRLWASYRAQTVARTIRGALSYQESLLQRFDRFEMKSGGPIDLKLHDFVELIVAHQTYGSYPKAHSAKSEIDGWRERRRDIEWILKSNAQYPIYLVYDLGALPKPKDRNPPVDGGMDFDYYWKAVCEPYWDLDEKEIKEYWETRMKEYGLPADKIPQFQQATCIKAMQNGKLKLVAVLPRINGLRIGKGKDMTQGKAANQVNALRCVSGHIIQVSDANMDGWIGEGYKLPFVTRQFIDGDPTRHQLGDRSKVLYRIIGFREYIFTGPLGAVASAMASSEFVFGTLFQRVLADPLDVRMHYGHPDFFDAFWVINRGTLSKASPRLNLSEDVFSGYNAALRGEKIIHVDNLEWQKGRETVFTASSGFLTKISSGSVAIQRTRDMKYMQLGLPFTKKLSLYYGGLGSFIVHLCIDYSITLYVLFFFFASYSNVTLADIQRVGSSLGFEWMVGLGIVSSLGYITEMMLEWGWGAGMARVVKTLLPTALFYLFQNKCMAVALEESIRTGEANYVETGRPNAFDHYTTRDMYITYANSHYYPALEKVALYVLYILFVGNAGGVLPMILVMVVTASWIFAPVLFCPQATDFDILMADFVQMMNFLFSTRDKLDDKNVRESMDKLWRTAEVKFHEQDALGTRFVCWILLLIPFLIIWTTAFSTFVDYCVMHFFMWLGHVMLTWTFFFSNYTNVVRAIWMFYPLAAMWGIKYMSPFPSALSLEAFMGFLLFVYTIRVVHWGVLLFASVIVRCRGFRKAPKDKEELTKPYYKLVNNLFFFGMQYHVHLYLGLLVALAQVVVQMTMMIILLIGGWILHYYRSHIVQSVTDTSRMTGHVKSN